MLVYTGLSPKKHLKKPHLGESQMKTVFSSYSVVVVMTRDDSALPDLVSFVLTKERFVAFLINNWILCGSKQSFFKQQQQHR
jgi:hypothetical protein